MSTANNSNSTLPTSTSKEKESFKVRAELYAPTRLAPRVYALFRARSLVTDVVAHECLLLVLLAAKSATLAAEANTAQLPRVGILGGGHMGCAVVMALLKHAYPVDKLAISTRQPERTPKCEALLPHNTVSGSLLPQFHAVVKYYDNARLSSESDVVVLCMPPSQLKSVAMQLTHALGSDVASSSPTLVVSALCGATCEQLRKACGTKLVARAKVDVTTLTDGDLKEESDGTGTSCAGNERMSLVESAARELAREQQDVLLQVLTDLVRLRGQPQPHPRPMCNSPLLAQEAARQARLVLFGRPSADDAAQLRPEQGGNGDQWHTGWDELLAVLQRACMRTTLY